MSEFPDVPSPTYTAMLQHRELFYATLGGQRLRPFVDATFDRMLELQKRAEETGPGERIDSAEFVAHCALILGTLNGAVRRVEELEDRIARADVVTLNADRTGARNAITKFISAFMEHLESEDAYELADGKITFPAITEWLKANDYA